MIANDRQYEITKAALSRFEHALDTLLPRLDEGDDNQRALRRTHRDAIESEIEVLRGQLADYDALRSGLPTTIRVESFADPPRVLIQARIAAGLTEQDLAERLGSTPEEIERDERAGYESAPVSRLIDVAGVLGVEFGAEIVLPVRAA